MSNNSISRTRRPLAALVAFATVTLVSACGGGAPSAGGAATHARGVKFAACMRSHGIGGFPDPSGSGNLTIDGIANGSSLNPNSPAFTQALTACKSLEPAGFTGSKRTPQQQAAAIKFARCVRSHGVPDFPDPTPDSPIIDTNRIPSADGRGARDIPGLEAAIQTCRPLVRAAL